MKVADDAPDPLSGRETIHPLIGRVAVCMGGRLGIIQSCYEDHDGRTLFVGRRVMDNGPWQSTSPRVLTRDESARALARFVLTDPGAEAE